MERTRPYCDRRRRKYRERKPWPAPPTGTVTMGPKAHDNDDHEGPTERRQGNSGILSDQRNDGIPSAAPVSDGLAAAAETAMELTYMDLDGIEETILEALDVLHDAIDRVTLSKQAVSDAGGYFERRS